MDMTTKPDPELIDQDAPEADAVWFATAEPAPPVLVALFGETTTEELLKPNSDQPSGSSRNSALDRLPAIAPALASAGVPPMSDDEIAAEVQSARIECRAGRTAQGVGKSLEATGS